MIEHLNGIYETVRHRENTSLRVYDNRESEGYPSHWHKELEIVMVVDGRLHIHCPGNEYNMLENDILLICPSIIHEIYKESEGKRLYYQADLSGFCSSQELNTAFSMMEPAILITQDTFPEIHQTAVEELLCIKDLYFGSDTAGHSEAYIQNYQHRIADKVLPFMNETLILSHLLHLIAGIAIACQQKKMAGSSRPALFYTGSNTAVQNACSYIVEHFSEPISLEEVSKEAGFSKYHFERIFRQFTDMSFYQYLTKIRISYAQKLMDNDRLNICQIAQKSGFTSGSAFTRAFRLNTGFTPTAYKKMRQRSTQKNSAKHESA